MDVVESRAEAEELELPPLIVREPLEEYLDGQGLGSGPIEVERIGEGHSNITYLVRRGREPFVLRRPPRPPLPPSAHDVLREARVLSARRGHPRARAGGAGGLRRRVGARSALLRHGVHGGHGDHDRYPAGARHARRSGAGSATSSWTRWSRCTPSTGRRAASRATASRPGYLERQLRRFNGLWEHNKTREVPLVQEVADWLAANMPESPEATIVHGDYRLGNTMVANDAPGAPGGDLRLGAVHDRRPAGGRRLPDRDLGRARRSGGHVVLVALRRVAQGGLPDARAS